MLLYQKVYKMQKSIDNEELCKGCGLCCQGIFHSYAYIYNDKDKQFAKDIHADIVYLEDDKLIYDAATGKKHSIMSSLL